MKISNTTLNRIEIALVSLKEHFSSNETNFTDIFIKLADTNILFLNDSEKIIATADINGEDAESFASDLHIFVSTLKKSIHNCKEIIESLNIAKPYSIILLDENDEILEDLYLVDNDLVIIDKEFLPDLSDDLESFFDNLMKD